MSDVELVLRERQRRDAEYLAPPRMRFRLTQTNEFMSMRTALWPADRQRRPVIVLGLVARVEEQLVGVA